MTTKNNPLIALDVYKMGHMSQFAPGTSKVYVNYCNRSDRYFNEYVFFGLQYYMQEYLSKKLTPEMGEEFLEYRRMIVGPPEEGVVDKIRSLCKIGYFPIKIKALPEGSIITKNIPAFTITETIPGYHWTVGMVESLLLKVWYPSVVATASRKYRSLVNEIFTESVDEEDYFLKDFMVHDFGYRSDSSEESAAISGVAHLLNFVGSDTVPALPMAIKNYYADKSKPIMLSVPASEHSVACSFGKEGEFEYFENMLNIYKDGIVSIVSDQYDVYKVFNEYLPRLKNKIVARNGKTVCRPDSGDQEIIICGDANSEKGSPQELGCIRMLDRTFGHKVNSKGYKVLHPSVGLIYGDGLYYDKYEKIQRRLMSMGYSAQNLVIGVGGILRNWTRDTTGVAIKATYVEKNGNQVEIYKDPITDPGKKSHKGLLMIYQEDGIFKVKDRCSWEEESQGLLQTVFENGKLIRETTLSEIRNRLYA
jgi:nicotinamide phosphoribosyltransferase